MRNAQPYGRYDQGLFNVTCRLADEMISRNYLHFLAELDASGLDRFRQNAKRFKLKARWAMSPSGDCIVVCHDSQPARAHSGAFFRRK